VNVVIACPATVSIVFVPADRRDASRPQLPFTCPRCTATVTHAGDHPLGPSIDDLVDFPYVLCGRGEALLAEAGALRLPVHDAEPALAA
jgi:hypothetical protein